MNHLEVNVQKLAAALERGEVRAIGGIVYSPDHAPLFNTTDMYHAVRELGRRGMRIERTDAGDAPTWIKL